VVDGALTYGAAGKGDTVKPADTFVIRSGGQLNKSNLQMGVGFGWSVTIK